VLNQSIMLGCASKSQESIATPLHGARIRLGATSYRAECRCFPDQFSFGTANARRREGAKSLRLITFEVASEPTLIRTVAKVFCKLLRIDNDNFRRGRLLHKLTPQQARGASAATAIAFRGSAGSDPFSELSNHPMARLIRQDEQFAKAMPVCDLPPAPITRQACFCGGLAGWRPRL
jgi:hypothetical protein